MKAHRLLRPLRFAILLGVVLLVALFLRGHSRYTIPEGDLSLSPYCAGGSTVVVRILDDEEVIERGDRVVYEMEVEGKAYARFGVVRGLPGDVLGSDAGILTVNGEALSPLPLRGEALGTVPEGHVAILANSPEERRYPDSRQLGFIPRLHLRGVVRFVFRG